MQFLMSRLQASARPDCGGQANRRGGEVKRLLALETVENWRRVASLTFDRGENIHPGHEKGPDQIGVKISFKDVGVTALS
jgi:hypothetical protein